MAAELSLDTSFLIDLDRELKAGRTGPAARFLEAHPETRLSVSFVVAGELAAGYSQTQRSLWEAHLAPLRLLDWTSEVAWAYARSYRYLHGVGQLIGTNDLWIAATSIAYDLPLVTGNEQHFRRVPGLEVLAYSV